MKTVSVGEISAIVIYGQFLIALCSFGAAQEVVTDQSNSTSGSIESTLQSSKPATQRCGIVSPYRRNQTSRKMFSEFPWRATLHKQPSPSKKWRFVCGATIIHNDLLITAAHCVYDENKRSVEDPSKFAVMTGNLIHDYESGLHDKKVVQKANVKRIYLNCNYSGLAAYYARDIAILEIDRPFEFSYVTKPVCIERIDKDQGTSDIGESGRVPFFPRTSTGEFNEVWKHATVPIVSREECLRKAATRGTTAYYTMDKFCAGHTNGSSVCVGSSGEGLTVKKNDVWYLRGTVSTSIGITRSDDGTNLCDYTLFTRIGYHLDWIQKVLVAHLHRNGTNLDCRNATSLG